jgi:hypothetical protein
VIRIVPALIQLVNQGQYVFPMCFRILSTRLYTGPVAFAALLFLRRSLSLQFSLIVFFVGIE